MRSTISQYGISPQRAEILKDKSILTVGTDERHLYSPFVPSYGTPRYFTHENPMFHKSDLNRHYGNRKLYNLLQRKRKSAKKFFVYDKETSFRYRQIESSIDWNKTFFQIWCDLIESDENQGYAFHISKIVYFYHLITKLSGQIITEDQTKEFKTSCQKYLQECRTPEGVDRIKDAVVACLRDDDDTVALDECKQWARTIANQVNCVVAMAFPWFSDENDWEYALDNPTVVQRISIGYACRFLPAGDSTVPYTKRLRLYKDSVTSCEGKTFRRLSNFQAQKTEAGKFYSDTEVKQLAFTRVLTYVSPGNLRDTFIPDQPTMRILTEIECICDSFIKLIPEIRIGKQGIPIKESPYYLMLDLKKFGLTFPHELLLDTLDAIGITLSVDVSYYKECIQNMIVFKDGNLYKMRRGFGLGNLNKLSTIAHYLIAKEFNVNFLVYSDDIVYCLDDYDDHVLNRFIQVYEAYGLIVNRKKTCLSTYWEFLGNSSYPGYEQRFHLTEICNMGMSIYGSEAECYKSESAILTNYFRISRPMKRVIFFNNHTIVPLDKMKLLVPIQSGGYLWTDCYGDWVETHSTYPVYTYDYERPRKHKFTYDDPQYTYAESFLNPVPLDYEWIRRPHGKLTESVSYPYRGLTDFQLFRLLIQKGYHPTFLLRPEHDLTENQASHYAEIHLNYLNSKWTFEKSVIRLEHTYPCEEKVLDLFSHCTNYPRMLLGEYHRRYRRIFSTPYLCRRRYTRELDAIQFYISYKENLTDIVSKENLGIIPRASHVQPTPTAEEHPAIREIMPYEEDFQVESLDGIQRLDNDQAQEFTCLISFDNEEECFSDKISCSEEEDQEEEEFSSEPEDV